MDIFCLARHSSQREHLPILRVKALGHPAHLDLKRNREEEWMGDGGLGREEGRGNFGWNVKLK